MEQLWDIKDAAGWLEHCGYEEMFSAELNCCRRLFIMAFSVTKSVTIAWTCSSNMHLT